MIANPANVSAGQCAKRRALWAVCIAVVALVMFALLAAAVVHQTRLVNLDRSVDEALRSSPWTTPDGTTAFTNISRLGSTPAMVGLGLGVTLILLATRYRRLALVALPIGVGGPFCDQGMKEIFHVPRPPLVEHLAADAKPQAAKAPKPGKPSWGFPSGHALGSMAAYGLAAFLLVRLWMRCRWRQAAIILSAATAILVIGFSRMYLHAHYLSQVLAGYCFGVFLLSLGIAIMECQLRKLGGTTNLQGTQEKN